MPLGTLRRFAGMTTFYETIIYNNREKRGEPAQGGHGAAPRKNMEQLFFGCICESDMRLKGWVSP